MDAITKLKAMLKLMEKEPKYLDKQKQCRINKKDREIEKQYKNINTFSPSNMPL